MDTLTQNPSRPVWRWIAVIFVAAFLIALPLDIPLSSWAHNSGLAAYLKARRDLTLSIRYPGRAWYPVEAVLALILRDARRRKHFNIKFWRDAALIALCAIFSASNAIFKWMIGRTRPFHGRQPFELHPFNIGILKAEQSLSFPSGDATLAFAMAAGLTMVLPRVWWIWWLMAIVVMVERVCENAHYPSDTVAGAALGVGCAWAARRVVQRLYAPIVSMGETS